MSVFSGKGFSFYLGERTYIMGILNYTPDSFSDGGDYYDVRAAAERASEMERLGADIIDIGACSTAPGRVQVDGREELRRVSELLPSVISAVSVPVSIDTYRPEIASYALSCGAGIVNDESGIYSEAMARVVREADAGWIYMHTGGTTSDGVSEYDNGIVSAVKSSFLSFIERAESFGINRSRLCMDMGIGFGKTVENNIELIKSVRDIRVEGVAMLAGLSRKRVIGYITGESDFKNRDAGTIVADTVAIAGGTDIIRVHDVKSAVSAARAADMLIRRK